MSPGDSLQANPDTSSTKTVNALKLRASCCCCLVTNVFGDTSPSVLPALRADRRRIPEYTRPTWGYCQLTARRRWQGRSSHSVAETAVAQPHRDSGAGFSATAIEVVTCRDILNVRGMHRLPRYRPHDGPSGRLVAIGCGCKNVGGTVDVTATDRPVD